MNLLAWAGYWFYDAASATERAALFASYGLLTDAPDYTPPVVFKRVWDWFWEFF